MNHLCLPFQETAASALSYQALSHSLKCNCIHDPHLYQQEAMDWVEYTTVAIRINQHLLWWCNKVIRKTKMTLSASHDFHTILPSFISIRTRYFLPICTSISAKHSHIQNMHPTLLFHGIKESLHWMEPLGLPGSVLKLPL